MILEQPKLLTPPQTEPVSLEEAKLALRITDASEDSLLQGYIKAAREYGEDFTGWAFGAETRITFGGAFPKSDFIELRQYPLIEVIKFSFKDYTGQETVLAGGVDYLTDTDSAFGRVVLPYNKNWPGAILYPVSPIRIEFKAGDAARLPELYKQAMLLHIGIMYRFRDEAIPAPEMQTIITLYNKYRLRW